LNSLHTDKSISPTTDKESEKAGITNSKGPKGVSNVMEYQCPTCGVFKEKLPNFRNHILTHYTEVFNPILPSSPPYICPECQALSRDKITLMRHLAFAHKKMFTLTDITEDNFKEIMATALVPKE